MCSSANPLSPALRSGPTAGSGASLQKQIPSNHAAAYGAPPEARNPKSPAAPPLPRNYPATGDWLVSGDRQQRETSQSANFYLWTNGDPASARPAALKARANGLMFLPPGSDTLIGSHSHRNDAWLWSTQTATETRPLGHDEPVFLMVSPDGSRLCTIGAAEGRLWNTRDWSILSRWPQTDLGKAVPAFSPDNSLLAIITPSGTAIIRNSHDGSEFLHLRPPRDLQAPQAVWLTTDRLLLISPVDGIHEWNLADLKQQALNTGLPW